MQAFVTVEQVWEWKRPTKADRKRTKQSGVKGKQRTNKRAEGGTGEISINQSHAVICYSAHLSGRNIFGVELRRMISLTCASKHSATRAALFDLSCPNLAEMCMLRKDKWWITIISCLCDQLPLWVAGVRRGFGEISNFPQLPNVAACVRLAYS